MAIITSRYTVSSRMTPKLGRVVELKDGNSVINIKQVGSKSPKIIIKTASLMMNECSLDKDVDVEFDFGD